MINKILFHVQKVLDGFMRFDGSSDSLSVT